MCLKKLIVFILVLLLVLVSLVACINSTDEMIPLEGEVTDIADDFISMLLSGDFKTAVNFFDAEMKKAMPQYRLSAIWQQLQRQVGEYDNKVGNRIEKIQEYDVVFVTTQFEQALIDIRVVFNSDKRIAGLFFEPANDANAQAYTLPSYGQPAHFAEKEVTIGTGEWELPGTLTIPNGDGPFPAVVLVHGSGPNDRDETIGPNKPFKDLASGLANQGIAVIRYDKRTLVYGQKIAAFENAFSVNEETIIDVHEAVDLLMKTDKIDPSQIYVLGHSLGGTLAPRIAKENDHIAGLIILAGATRPLEDLILMQTRYLAEADGSITENQEAQMKQIETQVNNIKDPSLTPDTPPSELLGVPASYWLDLRDYVPDQTAKELFIPMLILQGERDYQVTMEDFQIWKEAVGSKENVVFKSYADLNHLFIQGDGISLPGEYQIPGNVATTVVDDIAAFIVQ